MDDAIEIGIREFDACVEQAYRTLFPDDLDKSPELLHWRSRLNPHGPSRFVVATRGNDVVGLIALIPTWLRDGSDRRAGYQAVDTVVHPSCRGKGLFVRMGTVAQDAQAVGGDVLWGFPNANAAPGWYGRLGWTNFGPVPLLMRPLRTGFLLRRVHPKLARLDLPLVGSASASAVQDVELEDPSEASCLWEQIAPSFGMAVDRSDEWMRWRLSAKPGAAYRSAAVHSKAGTVRAFVSSKIEDKHGARLCYGLRGPTRQLDAWALAGLG